MPKEKLKVLSRTSYLYKKALQMKELEEDPRGPRAAMLIQAMLMLRVKKRRRRNTAMMIYEALDKWGTAGQLLLSMRMYHHRVRKIQRFWSKYGDRMVEIREKVKLRFREMEREIIISTLGVQKQGGGQNRRQTIQQGR